MTRRVAVLMGGTSGEREVSLSTGASVAAALRRAGAEVLAVEWRADGSFAVAENGAGTSAPDAAIALRGRADVVFPAVHGGAGEDGTLQGFLALCGLPFVGSGVCASALAMDKGLSRRVASSLDIAVAPAIEAWPDADSDVGDDVVAAAARLGFPAFVKPMCSGSSVGVTRVTQSDQLAGAIRQALAAEADGAGRGVLVESAIAGREVSCPVLGDAHAGARALPIVEIVPRRREFFDYRAKYTEGETDEICPARVTAEQARELERTALLLHDVFGCASLSRADFIVPERGPSVFLELNTLPGMTPLSLFPLSAKTAGIGYDDLCMRLVAGALDRMRPR